MPSLSKSARFFASAALAYACWAVLSAAAPPQNPAMNDYLFPIRSGRKLGFIDVKGNVIVAPQYDAVGKFSEGRARISAGSHSGYIDAKGKVIVEPKYTVANDYVDHRAVVRDEEHYYLLDESGKQIAQLPYRVMGEFHSGMLRVQSPRHTDANGKTIPSAYGFVDRSGKLVIPPQFWAAAEFPDDASNLNFGGQDKDWVYFDRTGKIIIRIPMNPAQDTAPKFSEGLLPMKEGFYWGYKDATGAWAIPAKYDEAGDFKFGRARVQLEGKWAIIDRHGQVLPQQHGPEQIDAYSEGYALVRDGYRYGWIDAQGNPAFALRKYDEAFPFSSGMARIKMDGLFGYLDRTGKLAIPNQFSSAENFDHGLAWVTANNDMGYIDTTGKFVWRMEHLKPGI